MILNNATRDLAFSCAFFSYEVYKKGIKLQKGELQRKKQEETRMDEEKNMTAIQQEEQPAYATTEVMHQPPVEQNESVQALSFIDQRSEEQERMRRIRETIEMRKKAMEEGSLEQAKNRNYQRELESSLANLPEENKSHIKEVLGELNPEQMVAVMAKAYERFTVRVADLIRKSQNVTGEKEGSSATTDLKHRDVPQQKIQKLAKKKWKELEWRKMVKFIITARDELIRQAQAGSAKRQDPADKKEDNPFIAYLANKNIGKVQQPQEAVPSQPVQQMEKMVPEEAPVQSVEEQPQQPAEETMQQEAPVAQASSQQPDQEVNQAWEQCAQTKMEEQ